MECCVTVPALSARQTKTDKILKEFLPDRINYETAKKKKKKNHAYTGLILHYSHILGLCDIDMDIQAVYAWTRC